MLCYRLALRVDLRFASGISQRGIASGATAGKKWCSASCRCCTPRCRTRRFSLLRLVVRGAEFGGAASRLEARAQRGPMILASCTNPVTAPPPPHRDHHHRVPCGSLSKLQQSHFKPTRDCFATCPSGALSCTSALVRLCLRLEGSVQSSWPPFWRRIAFHLATARADGRSTQHTEALQRVRHPRSTPAAMPIIVAPSC